jgi:Protein of unknown function (DUF1566)
MSSYQKIIFVILMTINSMVIAQTCQTTTIPATTPNNRFTILNNGTVKDNKTGLMWKQCSEGLSGSACDVGSAKTYTWQTALQQAQTINANGGFAGFADWRVPNIKELASITEEKCYSPTINSSIFPSTISDAYWSSSPVASYSNSVWIVYFGSGYDNGYGQSGNSYVRLVRGGQ